MPKLTQPLKCHGGKHYLAHKIVAMMPKHTHYVEPYAGGLSVLLAKPFHNVSEVVNDLDGLLTTFWRVLRSEKLFPKLIRRLEATEFSEVVFRKAREGVLSEDVIERAASLFILVRQSRQALKKSFATLSRNRTRRGLNEQVSSWLTSVEGLAEVHKRLIRVVVLNKPAIDVIESQDGPNTLFYLDPPYLHSTRSTTTEYGQYEMTPKQHMELLSTLNSVEGKFMLSGYPSKMYRKWAGKGGYNCISYRIDNKASSSVSKSTKIEQVWTNF